MSLNGNGDGLSSGFQPVRILPESGIVRLDQLHRVAGCSERTVELWVKDGLPVMRHRMKAFQVRVSSWCEFMERYDKGLPPKEPPAPRQRKKKDSA